MRDKKRIVAFVMTVTLSLVVVLLWGKKGEVVVLKDTGSSPETVPVAGDFEKKAHVIELDRSTLDQMASGECKRIELALFDGEVVEVELDPGRRQANGKNGAIIYGGVKGEEGSHFYASIVGEAMFAEVRLGDGREYKVDFVEEGKFKVVEVNTSVIIHHPGADKGPEYIVINGKKMPVARCYGTVVAKSDFTQVRMLGSDEWAPGLRILETVNEEEQFVSDVGVPSPVFFWGLLR